MAIIINTICPSELHNKIKKSINDGLIQTWRIDYAGDITITNPKWSDHAWFRIFVEDDKNRIIFGIIPSYSVTMSKKLYAIFHGRLSVTLLAHFDEEIDNLKLTAGFYIPYDSVPMI